MKPIYRWRLPLIVLLAMLIAAGGALADDGDEAMHLAPIVNAAACTTVVGPGQSIQAAITNAQSGHVICVRAGTYNEKLIVRVTKPGITVQAYPGERPILDGRSTIPPGKFEGLIEIFANNTIVDGFEVRNSAGRGIVVAQMTGDSQVLHNVTVRNNIIRGSQDAGINVNGTSTQHIYNILVENNAVYDNLRKNAGGDVGGSALAFLETENSIARGNTVYHNLGEGIVADRWTSNLTFEDNISYDNKHAGLYLSTSQNPLVQRNLIFCTDDRDYWRGTTAKKAPPGLVVRDEDYEGQTTKPPAGTGQVIINNIVVGCGNNLIISSQFAGGGLNNALIANNTFVNARGDVGTGAMNILFEGDASFKNSRFVNNVIMQSDASGQIARILLSLGTPDMSTFVMANNLYTYAPPKNWVNNEAGRVLGDPKLVNPVLPTKGGGIPAVAGYGLQSNSPAINAGTGVSRVTEDFFKQTRSTPLDIGADELGGVNPTTGRIIVAVSTTPDQSSQVFSFTAGYAAGGFQLRDNQSHDSGQIATGTHNVAMTAVSGWTATAACSDGSQPGAVSLAAGETVTCTFNATQQSQPVTRIIVRKETIPAGDPQSFQFSSNFAGSFQLTHNTQKQADVAPGTYTVSETIPSGWTQSSATCSDGSSPTAIGLTQGETVTCTFVNRKDSTGTGSLEATVYVSTSAAGNVGGVAFEKGDILAYDGRGESWSLYFDASDVQLFNALNDFVLMPDGSILMAISGRTTLSGSAGAVNATLWDVVQFTPTQLGNTTAGSFAMYFDGSDVGLTTASEKIDALARRSNGTLLISTYGAAAVPGGTSAIKAQDEDFLAFQPGTFGGNTQGSWSLAFDGSNIPGLAVEDVTAGWHDPATGNHYLSVNSIFSIGGVSGTPTTILAVTPSGAVSTFWDAAGAEFTWPVDGLHVAP